MNIKTLQGNIVDAKADALVNTVNCVGIMGRGVALDFKKKYPDNFKQYKKACDRQEVKIGKMFVYSFNEMLPPKYIINFPTKSHWRGNSSMAYIKEGLKDLIRQVKKLPIASIAIPPLGCGHGNLSWHEVKPLIKEAFVALPDVELLLYEPNPNMVDNGNYPHQSSAPSMTSGRAALILLMDDYIKKTLDKTIILLEIHKLVYFLQEIYHEPLRLDFTKEAYGPYAKNLRHLLNTINNYYIAGFEKSDKPENTITLLPHAIDEAKEFLQNESATKENIAGVQNLIEGFEDAFGLELLASVHWAMRKVHSDDLDKITNYIHAWSPRKKSLFTKEKIEIAFNILR